MQARLNMAITAIFVVVLSAGAAIAGTSIARLTKVDVESNTTTVPKQSLSSGEHPSFGASLSEEEKGGIEQTVREQLRAIAAQDAKQAFARLSPSTQHFFGQPDKFMRAVAVELPPVLNAKHFAFLGLEQDGSATYQQVLITDADGHDWLARFQVERTSPGDWRVKGCSVEQAPGQEA